MGPTELLQPRHPELRRQTVFNILASTVGLVYTAAAENIAWMYGTTDPLFAAERLTNDLMDSSSWTARATGRASSTRGARMWASAHGGVPQATTGPAAVTRSETSEPFRLGPDAVLSGAGHEPSTPPPSGSGERAVGTTGPRQTVTARDSGSGPLSILDRSVTGANAGVFTVASSTCGASVPRYASCSKDLAFTPAAQRARSGNLPSTDDAAGSPRAVALMGTGVLSPLTAVPTNVAATGPTEASR